MPDTPTPTEGATTSQATASPRPATDVALLDQDQAPSSPLLRPELAILLAVAVGAMLRVLQYGAGRSLWLDEVLMVRGIVGPSLGELLSPSRWTHVPPGFLVLEKLSVTALGASDYALRLVPFLAGMAVLFLAVPVARRYLTPTAIPIAAGLFAFSPFLIYYSSELKPYSTDVLVTLGLLLLASKLLAEGVTPKRAAAFGLASVFAAGLSMTSVFVSVGIATALLVFAWRRGDKVAALSMAGVFGAWAVVFGAPYLAFVHGSATNEYAREFWRSGFMPLPPTSVDELAWFPRTFFQVFRDPLGVFSDRSSAAAIWAPAAAMAAFGAGAWRLAKQDPARLWILVAPVIATLLASGLMLYPFGGSRVAGGRVLLFLVPVFLLVMAEGAAWAWDRFRGEARIVPLALLALLFVPALSWGAVAVPVLRTEVKPLLDYLEDEAQPGDVLYVHYDVRHAFGHYSSNYELDGIRYVRGICARGEPARYLDALSGLRGQDRVWVLFANGTGAGLFDEKSIMVDYLEHVGARLDDQVTVGASLYLFDLRSEAGSDEPYSARLPVVPLSVADGCALWN